MYVCMSSAAGLLELEDRRHKTKEDSTMDVCDLSLWNFWQSWIRSIAINCIPNAAAKVH